MAIAFVVALLVALLTPLAVHLAGRARRAPPRCSSPGRRRTRWCSSGAGAQAATEPGDDPREDEHPGGWSSSAR
uniref:Uncharacterized protein n=1 Tax=Oryza barthii TaxID=65489 RepID=A0A0D3GRP0_9ORYZ